MSPTTEKTFGRNAIPIFISENCYAGLNMAHILPLKIPAIFPLALERGSGCTAPAEVTMFTSESKLPKLCCSGSGSKSRRQYQESLVQSLLKQIDRVVFIEAPTYRNFRYQHVPRSI